mmetsp:Transcript_45868/g.106626  ORF Transcript_45868/g.106626 Transcript_45868/m.106626 type:complete len:262 (+) Transcript_45868:57-842(+)
MLGRRWKLCSRIGLCVAALHIGATWQARTFIRVLHETDRHIVAGRPVTAFQMNQYIVGCKVSKECALVDCGDSRVEEWDEWAVEQGMKIQKVMQTHAHVDHIAGLAATQRHFQGVPVHVHEGEDFWMSNVEMQGAFFGMPVEKPDKPAAFIADGEVIKVGNISFDVIHTPGHTPGQVVFHSKGQDIAFTGDMLFAGSIGRSDFPLSDSRKMAESLHRILDDEPDGLPGSTLFFPGHNEPSTIAREREGNPYWLQVLKTGYL